MPPINLSGGEPVSPNPDPNKSIEDLEKEGFTVKKGFTDASKTSEYEMISKKQGEKTTNWEYQSPMDLGAKTNWTLQANPTEVTGFAGGRIPRNIQELNQPPTENLYKVLMLTVKSIAMSIDQNMQQANKELLADMKDDE